MYLLMFVVPGPISRYKAGFDDVPVSSFVVALSRLDTTLGPMRIVNIVLEGSKQKLHFASSQDTQSIQDRYIDLQARRLPIVSDLLYRQDTRIILTILITGIQF